MAPETTAKDKKQRKKPGRVPTSCAECRRLKLRCNREVPCSSCEKRGCSSICPDGCLTSGKGNRLVLATTEELHERVERLCSRIRELEDALRTLQLKVSNEEHPLLAKELLQIRQSAKKQTESTDNEMLPPDLSGSSAKLEDDSVIDAFGTLRIGPSGETTFLGPTARSEYFINAPTVAQAPPLKFFPHFSDRIAKAVASGSNYAIVDLDLGREVFSLLPSFAEATRLCDLFLLGGKCMWSPTSREELINDCLFVVYRAGSFDNLKAYHALSLLFIVLALGSLVDPLQPPYPVIAYEYQALSWLSFHFLPVMYHVTLHTVQTSFFTAMFFEKSDEEFKGTGKAWIHLGVAVKFSQMIGLHLNNARWKLDKTVSDRRSRLFWQIFTLDTWLSIFFGRPPNMNMEYIDCPLPEDLDEVINSEGKKEVGLHYWTWQYTRLLHTAMVTVFGVKRPPYSSILDLDKKIRDFPVPEHLRPVYDFKAPLSPYEVFERWSALSCKDWVLLYVHRSYFAVALHEEDRPDELLKHKYGPSVMAAYRSSWRIIDAFMYPAKNAPFLTHRCGIIWSQVLSASIALCLFITQVPRSSLTAAALEKLRIVVELFEEASPHCSAAAHSLATIQKLYQKAHEAVEQSASQAGDSLTPTELARLSGRTHLLSEPSPEYPTIYPFSPSDLLSNSSIFTSDISTLPYKSVENIHPTVLQNMKAYDGLDPVNFYDIQEPYDFPPEAFSQSMEQPQVQQFADGPDFDVDVFGIFNAGDFSDLSLGVASDQPVVDAEWKSFIERLGLTL